MSTSDYRRVQPIVGPSLLGKTWSPQFNEASRRKHRWGDDGRESGGWGFEANEQIKLDLSIKHSGFSSYFIHESWIWV